MTKTEQLADAILRAAGSGLRHYSMPCTRKAIINAVQAAYDAGHEDGWREFGQQMMKNMTAAPKNGGVS